MYPYLFIFAEWLFIPVCAIFYIYLERKYPLKIQENAFKSSENYFDIIWYYLTVFVADKLIIVVSFLASYFFWSKINSSANLIIDINPVYAVLLSLLWIDFASFLYHYCAHRIKLLWSFHRVHHSPKNLNSISGFRNFWAEELLFNLFTGLCYVFIKLPPVCILGIELIRGHCNFFIHANVKIDLGRFQGWIPCSSTHHWHHSLNNIHRYGQNFGSYTYVWDRLFGTLYVPKEIEAPLEYGLVGEYNPNGPYMRVLEPFVSRDKYLTLKAKIKKIFS